MGNFLSQENAAPAEATHREKAAHHAEQRHICFQKSQEAYQAGRHEQAKSYSQQGKQHGEKVKHFNQLAADSTFQANNSSRPDGHIDLHGLHVNEALKYATAEIVKAKQEGKTSLVFIVGRGLHSRDGVAKLKPAIQKLIVQHNLRCQPNVPNEGCLLVDFTTPEKRGWLDWVCVIC